MTHSPHFSALAPSLGSSLISLVLLCVVRPLWRFEIVQNYSDPGKPRARCALIAEICHAIGDGTTLVEVLFSLLDNKALFPAGKRNVKRAGKTPLQIVTDPLELSRRAFAFGQGAIRGFLFGLPVFPKGLSCVGCVCCC